MRRDSVGGMKLPKPDQLPTLHDLYPNLSEEELRIVEEAYDRYVEFTLRLYERISDDAEAYAQFKALTASVKAPTMYTERSNKQ